MNQAYLLIGGNEGNRMNYLEQAVTKISQSLGEIRAASSVYETEPWGKNDQPAFLNCALLIDTPLDADALMQAILRIEESMGRQREEKYGPRSIDIDIIFFNNEVIRHVGLTIPHPEMARRRFVLEPLNEIAPDYVHPLLNKTVAELLAACTDELDVKKIPA